MSGCTPTAGGLPILGICGTVAPPLEIRGWLESSNPSFQTFEEVENAKTYRYTFIHRLPDNVSFTPIPGGLPQGTHTISGIVTLLQQNPAVSPDVEFWLVPHDDAQIEGENSPISILATFTLPGAGNHLLPPTDLVIPAGGPYGVKIRKEQDLTFSRASVNVTDF